MTTTQKFVRGDVAAGKTLMSPAKDCELLTVLPTMLDHAAEILPSASQADTALILDRIIRTLTRVQASGDHADWTDTVSICRNHPVFAQIHQDPLTHRAFVKPDGYPGDARLLDLIYGLGDCQATLSQATDLGRRIYRCTRMGPACVAVRNRTRIIAERIGETLKYRGNARILSVAGGHAREMGLLPLEAFEEIERFIILDNDEKSLEYAANTSPISRLHTVKGTIREIILDTFTENEFDLIYALGIYDYLNKRTARRLTKSLFDRIKPGGKLIIANFKEGTHDRGYMEAIMDWNLIFRDEKELEETASSIDISTIRKKSLYSEDSGQVIFFELQKS